MEKLGNLNNMFEKIGALSKVQRIAICSATFLFLMVSFYFIFYSPNLKKITRLEEEYSKVKGELARAITKAKSLPRLEKELEEMQLELRKAMQLLPDKKEIPRLLEEITVAGKMAGLEFLLFKPGKEAVKDMYAEFPVDIKVTGVYHETAVFFDKISKLSRIVNVCGIKIKGGDKDNLLTTSCSAKTYRFLEGSNAAKRKK